MYHCRRRDEVSRPHRVHPRRVGGVEAVDVAVIVVVDRPRSPWNPAGIDCRRRCPPSSRLIVAGKRVPLYARSNHLCSRGDCGNRARGGGGGRGTGTGNLSRGGAHPRDVSVRLILRRVTSRSKGVVVDRFLAAFGKVDSLRRL